MRQNPGSDSFAAVLDQAVQDAPTADPQPRQAPTGERDPGADEPVTDGAAELPPEPRQHPDVDAGDGADADVATGDVSSHERAAAPEATETLRRGESERRESAGKGPDSPRTSTAKGNQAEPLLAAVVQRGGTDQTLTGAVTNAGNGTAAIGAPKAGEALTRGFDLGQARSSTPTRATAVAPGYRTDTKAGAELLEHARDSVFKQILMQLDAEGGEMRVRLQPPDLGELDLRLLVEHGNKLTLTIAAERADLTLLLQKHLDELKQTLQASGLEVTDAHVHQRGAGAAREDSGFRSRDGRAPRDAANDAAEAVTTLRRSYVTAEGLDFWA
ncbi:MAG: flagellar hook-length control protein FliK [Planctomycetes bacterium]|nr:flagellar hook-length control protein FliK [Planctomycetota bacterium]